MKIRRITFEAGSDFQPGDLTEVTIVPAINGTARARRLIQEARNLHLTLKSEPDPFAPGQSTVSVTGDQATVDAFAPRLAPHVDEVQAALEAYEAAGDYLVMITRAWLKGERAVEIGVRVLDTMDRGTLAIKH